MIKKISFHGQLHVLAIDDDQTCLASLESLLRKCQYHVTTTKNAITALKLLRENKGMFDLVISDVHMPDMDGFKLLELVRFEMDLPVILVSVNDDPEMVMRGATLGACNYLKKPVRIEVLQNIWQYVLRRKKFDLKEKNKTCIRDKPDADSSNGVGSAATGDSYHYGKSSKKYDNEDTSTQKKPQIDWNAELLNNFVSAFDQLDIKKDMSKRTVDLMNLEKLTRENLASNIQKCRLLMERYRSLAYQQPNMMASLGTSASSNLRMSSLSGAGFVKPLSIPQQFHNNAFKPFSLGGKTVMEDHIMDDLREQFPNGLSVLLVNDNQTCLMILETTLRGCQYHVTTTKSPITALKLLRENKTMFDLVVSNIHMPDTDGFKLLKLVVLEMDLPMIMLTVYGTKVVMKGVTHEACDYLVKPVTSEELKNIWQHIIKRKKDDLKNKTGNEDKTNADSTNAEPSTERKDCDESEEWELL